VPPTPEHLYGRAALTIAIRALTTRRFALKGADSTTGPLKTLYDGVRPKGYQPMKKQGSIILGIGGDNSDSAHGTFYGKQAQECTRVAVGDIDLCSQPSRMCAFLRLF
jgi:hypothetical protein